MPREGCGRDSVRGMGSQLGEGQSEVPKTYVWPHRPPGAWRPPYHQTLSSKQVFDVPQFKYLMRLYCEPGCRLAVSFIIINTRMPCHTEYMTHRARLTHPPVSSLALVLDPAIVGIASLAA